MTDISKAKALDLLGDLIPESAKPKPKSTISYHLIEFQIIYLEERCTNCGTIHRRPNPRILAVEEKRRGTEVLATIKTDHPTSPIDNDCEAKGSISTKIQYLSPIDFCTACLPDLMFEQNAVALFHKQSKRLAAEDAAIKAERQFRIAKAAKKKSNNATDGEPEQATTDPDTISLDDLLDEEETE